MALHRIAVGELVPELLPGSDAWRTLVAELERTRPDLLVLNELPFGPWLAAREQFDGAAWEESIEAHAAGLAALPELGVPVVVGTRPVDLEGRRCNQAFVSRLDAEPLFPHTKQHIPNSPGYRETTWTSPCGPVPDGILARLGRKKDDDGPSPDRRGRAGARAAAGQRCVAHARR